MTKLKPELPMSNAMYVKLINTVAKTTPACCSCRHSNGECQDFAKNGTCNAMNTKINHILVFSDEFMEFATTRSALAHALEVNQDNEENLWIGETVDAVIEDYQKNHELALWVYDLLSSSDILCEINNQ